MSKKVETQETLANSFDGFDILNGGSPPKKVEIKSEDKVDLKDDELSEDELAALEAASKLNKQKPAKVTSKKDTEETIEEQEETEEIEEEENPIAVFGKWLSEENVLDLEETDKLETEADLKRVTKKTIQNGIEKYKDSVPEDGKKFLEFLEQGGKPDDFHKYYYGNGSFEGFDITSEENQKYVIEESLKLEGHDDEYIKEELADIEDTGKLDKKAGVHLKKLQKIEKENKALLLESQKTFAKQQEEARQTEWEEFKKGLYDKEAIGGFKLSEKSKDNLWNYMTKVVNKKEGFTQYQIDANSNGDARYMAAYLQMNKWDTSSLEKMVESKKTSELRSKLGGFTDTRNKQKGSPSKITKEEVDLNPFAGFEKIINK